AEALEVVEVRRHAVEPAHPGLGADHAQPALDQARRHPERLGLAHVDRRLRPGRAEQAQDACLIGRELLEDARERGMSGLCVVDVAAVAVVARLHHTPKINRCITPAPKPKTAPCRTSSHSSSRMPERKSSAKSREDISRTRSAISVRTLRLCSRLKLSSWSGVIV